MLYRWSLFAFLMFAATASAQVPLSTTTDPTNALPMTALTDGAIHIDLSGPDFDRAPSAGSSGGLLSGNHSFSNFIGFVGNPLQNIDPRAVTAIYPIFGSSWTSVAGPVPDADLQLYGPAFTVALSDRLAIGLNQGGYANVQLSRKDFQRLAALDPLGRFSNVEIGGNRAGFVNLGGFVQYTFIEDVPNQFLVTGGMRWIAPCGSHEIFQGYGPLELAPYLTVGKELEKFHVLATTGYQFPAGPGSDNDKLFYANIHLDRQTFGWLYPLIEVNWTTHEKSVSFGLPTRTDFIDFGNFEASGNIVTLSVGANTVLIPERLELGAVYSTPLATQHDFNFNGLLVKMVLRF